MGQQGILDELKHTSNDPQYLQAMAPQYKGTEHYQNALAVSDGNLITASGIGSIEFARELFRKLGLYSEEDLEKWFQLFKNGIWTG